MKREEIIRILLEKAESDIITAKKLFEIERYDWSLFIWHLVVERVLKAKIISIGKDMTYTHDLLRLAKKANLDLDDKTIDELREITTFNIEARYDDYKLSFYKKADKEYSQKWNKICERIYLSVKNTI